MRVGNSSYSYTNCGTIGTSETEASSGMETIETVGREVAMWCYSTCTGSDVDVVEQWLLYI